MIFNMGDKWTPLGFWDHTLCFIVRISQLRGQDPSSLVHNHRRIDLAQVCVITKVCH